MSAGINFSFLDDIDDAPTQRQAERDIVNDLYGPSFDQDLSDTEFNDSRDSEDDDEDEGIPCVLDTLISLDPPPPPSSFLHTKSSMYTSCRGRATVAIESPKAEAARVTAQESTV